METKVDDIHKKQQSKLKYCFNFFTLILHLYSSQKHNVRINNHRDFFRQIAKNIRMF